MFHFYYSEIVLNAYYLQIFINNEFVNSESGKVFPTINPANGEKIADVQEGDQVRLWPGKIGVIDC